MPDPFRHLPDNKPIPSWRIRQSLANAARATTLKALHPLTVQQSQQGQMIDDVGDTDLDAILTKNNGDGTYQFVEAYDSGSTAINWSILPNGEAGTCSEINRDSTLVVPRDARLHLNNAGNYFFETIRSGMLPNPCPAGYFIRIIGAHCCNSLPVGIVVKDGTGATVGTGTYIGATLTIVVAAAGVYTITFTPEYLGAIGSTTTVHVLCGGVSLLITPFVTVDTANYICCSGLIPLMGLTFTWGPFSTTLNYTTITSGFFTFTGWYGFFSATVNSGLGSNGPPCHCQAPGTTTNFAHVFMTPIVNCPFAPAPPNFNIEVVSYTCGPFPLSGPPCFPGAGPPACPAPIGTYPSIYDNSSAPLSSCPNPTGGVGQFSADGTTYLTNTYCAPSGGMGNIVFPNLSNSFSSLAVYSGMGSGGADASVTWSG